MSILIRQTNIIWVAFITVEHLFDLLDHKISKLISYEQYNSIIYLKVSKLLSQKKKIKIFIIFEIYIIV